MSNNKHCPHKYIPHSRSTHQLCKINEQHYKELTYKETIHSYLQELQTVKPIQVCKSQEKQQLHTNYY
jgi:hypothetical protein